MIQKNKYTIKKISKEIDISDQTISNWINGRNISTIKKFLEVTTLLNFTAEDYKKLLDD